MTIRETLQAAYQRLSHIDSARLDAQILLSHVLDVEKAYLIAYDDRVLSADEAAQFESLLQRRAMGEPIAYILGTKGFYDLDFIVTPDVLIPRPETEHLIEAALQWARRKEKMSLFAADIGTGSGAIAVTFAKHTPQAHVHAVDISSAALTIAQENASRNQATIQFHHGNLAQPLIDANLQLDLLMANLPYIRSDEMPMLAVSKHEPHLALEGGDDGLDLVRDLLRQVPQVCHAGALILLEIGAEQGQAVLDFANETLSPKNATIIKDYAGHDRIVRFQLR
ncbi:MAG: peptide chain release factor N(5)-glutamine methyltransferase [Anaerolineae bacterium]|nr:peptide chain release factor N(5)-glutamine methyltransferase [Anaerolineae bacterium]